MSRGMIDGTVRDVKRAEHILSLLMEIVKPGSIVRVSTNIIRVDKRGCEQYPTGQHRPGEVRNHPISGESL